MKKKTNFNMMLNSANNVMSKIEIPKELQEDVHDYLQKTQNTREQQVENDKFFDIISPSKKVIVQHHIFESNLRKNNIIIDIIG